jgi:hypothetical protein
MSDTAEKARALRLSRLKNMIDNKLDQPPAAIEALLLELEAGESQRELWEGLHAAAARDGLEQALGAAYQKVASSQRMNRVEPKARAEFYLHVADYFQGVLGDATTSEAYLEKVTQVVPGHAEAFARLEPRVESAPDPRRALELYAGAAAQPPIAPATLAVKAMNRLLILSPKQPLADEACKKLVELVPAVPRLLNALEGHCVATGRSALAAHLIESALLDPSLPGPIVVEQRYRAIELYLGDAGTPAAAIDHVEDLLARDPGDAAAKKAAEKLLSVREVASRAAAAIAAARRSMAPVR